MKANPYSLVFGKAPNPLISRNLPLNAITEAFLSDNPSQRLIRKGILDGGMHGYVADKPSLRTSAVFTFCFWFSTQNLLVHF